MVTGLISISTRTRRTEQEHLTLPGRSREDSTGAGSELGVKRPVRVFTGGEGREACLRGEEFHVQRHNKKAHGEDKDVERCEYDGFVILAEK